MNRRDRQKGFLAIVAILIVVIIAFIAVTATYQFAGDSLASFNHLRSAQAFYIAQSGMEQAKHDIVTSGNTCNGYSSGTQTVTPSSGSGSGQYSVTGSTSSANSTLNGAITNSATSITVANASGFTTPGAFQVDTEIIYYSGISGNTLTGAVRGINGTSAVAHANGTAVQQNECFLTSTAGVPTISSPNGKRILKALIFGTSFGFQIGGNFTIPSMSSSGNFSLQGNPTIANPSVTINGPGFPGANIITTASSLNTTGNSWQTTVSGGTVSSTNSNQIADIQTGTSLFNSSNFVSQYFNMTASQLQTLATNGGWSYPSGSNIVGLSGSMIYYNGNLTISGSGSIGTPSAPVLLIVNGNLDLGGTLNVYGFVFVLGTADVEGNSTVTGALASQGDVLMQGSSIVTLDQGVLNGVNNLTGNLNVKYSNNAIYLEENFQ